MKLSILVPVYNERTVVERSLSQVLAAPLPEPMEREIIVVDECSEEPARVIGNLANVIRSGGRLVILAPQGTSLFGPVDKTMGHRERFEESDLRRLLEDCELSVERVHQHNRFGKPIWWLYCKVLRLSRIGKPVLKIFDRTVWLWRILDPVLPWKGYLSSSWPGNGYSPKLDLRKPLRKRRRPSDWIPDRRPRFERKRTAARGARRHVADE